MKISGSSFKLGIFVCLYSFFSLQSAFADDTEVFFAGSATSSSSKPNVLFIFDTSGSMSSNQKYVDVDGTVVSNSRLGILQDVLSDFMASQTGINMGLARFSVPGGPILYPVADPDAPADPIVLRSLAEANDDAIQVGNSVTLDSDYLDPTIVAGNSIIGIRFQNLAIPQGATITNAVLQLSTDVDSLDPATYEIYAEIVPSAEPFGTSRKDLSSRISGSSVTWNVDPWDAVPILTSADVPTTFETPNISSVIQQVVNQKGTDINDPAGWCGGNDMVILLKKTTSIGRQIIAYEKNREFSPKLRVDFDANIPASENGCYVNSFTKSVESSNADSEKRDSGAVLTSDSDIDFYQEYQNSGPKPINSSIALSFKALGIPQGATIFKANLNFIARRSTTTAGQTTIYAVNNVAPPTDETVHDSTNLTAGVDWSMTPWQSGVSYDSVDISGIISPIVANAAWSESSDMSFLLKGSKGLQAAYSYDNKPGSAAKLVITFRGRYSPKAATKRGAMIAAVEDFKALGNTPISDTYAEALLYFKGENVTYGLQRGNPVKRDNRISHVDATVGGVVSTPTGCPATNPSDTACKDEKFLGSPLYKSPIKDACQANHIVLLTDGEPTSQNSITNQLYARWTKELSPTGDAGSCSTNDRGVDCTEKLAGLAHNNDVLLTTADDERITTHTIGFYSQQDFLQNVATLGGGTYNTAFSKEDLINALNDIVETILDVNTTFVSAGVTVNQYNRLTHNDQLYFSLFAPSKETVWPGNLKRYRLAGGKLVDSSDPAIDAVSLSGKFNDNAKSFWSSTVDGDEVEIGGAAEQMTATRNVYSDLGASSLLTDAANDVDRDNGITPTMVGAADINDMNNILDWVNGMNVNDSANPTAPRHEMGDPLHSQPTLLIYRTGTDTFRTSVFVGSNEGYVHSFNSDDGTENWAYIPKELLPRLSEVQKNSVGSHTYGMDGSVTLYIEEKDVQGNFPGVVDPGESAYLYIGMRRGGSSYYALDVSNPTQPKLKFKIDAGTSGFDGIGGTALGQTWSQPVIKKMNIFPGHETVMIFGGGYSTVQDSPGTSTQTDDSGRNVFIADAFTGEHLWDVSDAHDAGSLSSMNSVPNEITAFDFDGDDNVDHFYATDTKAQVFRFDVDADSGKITGGRIAHLQDSGDASNNRRFYNSPDVSLIRLTDESFVSIAIGSGYRAHPLDETVVDHFYLIKDKGILSNTFDMDAALGDLLDVTNIVGDVNNNGVSDASELIKSQDKKGWYISFPRSGEKVITNSITFNNAVIFTTYTPPAADGSDCNAISGKSRIYGMKADDGNPYLDNDSDSLLTNEDRAMELTTQGIAPQPQVIFEPGSDGVQARLCVGNQCSLEKFLPPIPEGIMGIRWQETSKN